MAGYQAAMGVAQLNKIDHVIEEKRRVAHTYNRYLDDIPGLQLPVELDWARSVYWMYALTVKPDFGLSRDHLVDQLAAAGIETRTFFCPMNQQPCLRDIPGFRADPLPVADSLWASGLYLPSTHTLPEATIQHISNSIHKIYQGAKR